jgi:hypothetical protein
MPTLSRVRAIYRKRRQWRWLIQDERNNPSGPSWSERLRAWRKGFLSYTHRFYGLDGRDASDYVSDRTRYLHISFLNEPYATVLHDKLLFHEVFRRHKRLMPELYAILRRKNISPMSDREWIGSIDDVLSLLSRKGRLVVKGTWGHGGYTVAVLEERDGAVFLGGVAQSADEFRRFLATRRRHLLMEYVEQAAYAREIFPHSANTIRLQTFIDDETGEAFMPLAMHRFGGRDTRGVDNFTAGGAAANIDVETGVLGRGIREGSDGRPVWIERHPDTGARITGLVIPRWRETVAGVVAIAREHPYLPYVGWDVLLTDDGFRILEGNSNTAIRIFQAEKPMLADPRIRKFFQRRGAIE